METHQHHPHFSFIGTLIPLVIAGGVLLLYLIAAARQSRSPRGWNGWRTASFVVGIGLLLIAFAPPVAEFAHQDLRGHMLQHLLIGMFAPLGLVLAAPLTLAFRTLPIKISRLISAILGNKLVHWLSHPVTAFGLNIGGMYLLYLTPLYVLSLNNPYLHYCVHLHFLVAGYLFTWAIAGPDPAPRRPNMQTRLIVLFVSIAAHANLSKLMYGYLWPQNTPHSDEEIRAATQLMYYGGDFAELLLVIALFATWYAKRGRRLARVSPPIAA